MRTRWAAVGAAVAVSLGGGAVFVANAATVNSEQFVAIEPCRFNDTRGDDAYDADPLFDEFQEVGIVDQDVMTIDFNSVDDGLCNDQFDLVSIESIVLNVTVTEGTKASYLSIWPGDESDDASDAPKVSSLNWVPLETFPNAVTVQVDVDGKVNFYNRRGDVHVVIDVVGYFI